MMLSLDGVKVEAEPGTVVYVKESADTDFERHTIGPTHTLNFDAEDSAIEGLYFAGIHFEPATAAEQERETLPNNKYIETGITLDKYISDTSGLIKNGVYTAPYMKDGVKPKIAVIKGRLKLETNKDYTVL